MIESTTSSHPGAREMLYFQSTNGNKITLTSDGTPLAIPLFTPTQFSYQWRISSKGGAVT
jgi:hypothetical protein